MPRLIRTGDQGPQVRDVQQRLARLIEPGLPVDGSFGPTTVHAVRRFQRLRGLEADGVVGPETWRGLVEAGFSLGDRLLWRSGTMMRGDDVRGLQARLNELGFDAGPEDGLFGPLTHRAVEEFQRNAGLEVDAVVGPATVEALRRLRRAHQSSGLGIRAREREWLRRVAGRGLPGTRVLLDPGHGRLDAGHVGPAGTREAEVTWQICARLSARLAAGGAHVVLARGPATDPSPSERALLANEQGVDLVLSVATNALDTASATGSSSYYFGSSGFVSEAGYRLAQLVQEAVVADGWVPDCRTHPVTWAILRETRMPAVVVEPGFITSPADERRLAEPSAQEGLAAALTAAVTRFFTLGSVDLTTPPVAVPAGD